MCVYIYIYVPPGCPSALQLPPLSSSPRARGARVSNGTRLASDRRLGFHRYTRLQTTVRRRGESSPDTAASAYQTLTVLISHIFFLGRYLSGALYITCVLYARRVCRTDRYQVYYTYLSRRMHAYLLVYIQVRTQRTGMLLFTVEFSPPVKQRPDNTHPSSVVQCIAQCCSRSGQIAATLCVFECT